MIKEIKYLNFDDYIKLTIIFFFLVPVAVMLTTLIISIFLVINIATCFIPAILISYVLCEEYNNSFYEEFSE